MKQFCEYFKTNAVRYYNSTKSIIDTIDVFGICRKTLYNWRSLDSEHILNEPTKYKAYASKYTPEIVAYVERYISNNQRFRMKVLKLMKRKFNSIMLRIIELHFEKEQYHVQEGT